MKKLTFIIGIMISIFTVSSCSMYRNYSSHVFSLEDLNLGMEMNSIIEKYGAPYSFNKNIEGSDTITILSYKSPKPIANYEFIVSTNLVFTNNKLNRINQSTYLISGNVEMCDSSKVKLE